MRAAKVALGDDDALDAVPSEELLDLFADFEIVDDVGADKSLDDGYVAIAKDDAGGDLGGGFVVGAIVGNCSDGIFPVAQVFGFGRAAEFVFIPAAAGAGVVGANIEVDWHGSPRYSQ
jgi:hypothetical protein